MLMWIFVLFVAIALILTLFGFLGDLPLFSFIGTIMLFLLGIGLLNDGLDYKVGENVTSSINEFNVTSSQSVDVYGSYDDSVNRFGWYLLTLGSLAFVLAWFTL